MDGASRFPLASKVARQDVYVDDVVSGAQNLDTARQLQCQLQNMLETCGMKLQKWNSNSKELLNLSSDQEHSFSTNAESATADIISRGVNPEELSSLTLWWNGCISFLEV
ncbi:uncharacterized protein TNCV_4490561 [Trichonephila clavipes]|nr:uncharacterized protein TNCV_4490561 [Trichonephila clavipes]